MPAASPGCCGPFRKREAEGGRASGPTPARASGPTPARASAGPSSREGAGHPKAEPADARVSQDVSRRIDRQVSCEAPTKPAECLRPAIVPDLRRPTRPARRPPRRVFPVGAQASPSASRAGDAFAWSGRALGRRPDGLASGVGVARGQAVGAAGIRAATGLLLCLGHTRFLSRTEAEYALSIEIS